MLSINKTNEHIMISSSHSCLNKSEKQILVRSLITMIINNYNSYVEDKIVRKQLINNFISMILTCVSESKFTIKNTAFLKEYNCNANFNLNIKYIIQDWLNLNKNYEHLFDKSFKIYYIDLLCLICDKQVLSIFKEITIESNFIN